MVTPTPVTVEDLGEFLNMSAETVTAKADELGYWLAAATLAVEGRVGPIVVRSFSERLFARNGVLVAGKCPLVEVTAVESVLGVFAGTTYDVALMRWHKAGIIRRDATAWSWFPLGEYDVTYDAGRAEPGENLGGAVLITAGHLWETQRGSSARGRTLTEFDGAQGSNEVMSVLRGFALPRRALELLQPDEPGMVFA